MKDVKNESSLKNKILIITNVVLIVVIFVLIFFIFNRRDDESVIFRDNEKDFNFTNPILDCEDSNQGGGWIISQSEMNKKVEEVKENYNLLAVSIYIRDLNNGPWLGVNAQNVFSPASLLKTPIVMALFKYAENNPDILKKEIEVKESDTIYDKNQNIVFSGVIEKGKKYTLLQIAESVIEKSDNAGVGIIINNIPAEYIAGVFNSIGVPYKDVNTEVELRVKDFASFFRVLFNASYLNREMSEKLLDMLSKTEYHNGIVAGVPEGAVVAHKFGERDIYGVKQLHDCGVVYYTQKPYLICVMTRGGNFKSEESAIKDISSYVYQKVSKNSSD